MQKNNTTRGRYNPVIPPSDSVSDPRPIVLKTPKKTSTRKPQALARQQRIDSYAGTSTVSALLPRNEQSMLREFIDSDREKSVRDYLHCLVRPDECASRIPDSFSGDTALVSSVTVIKTPVFFSNMGTDAGRFSVLIQPTIGSLDKPSQYKVAQVKTVGTAPNYVWPTDLTNSANFTDLDNGMDIRLDRFYSLMTQPTLAYRTENGDSVTSSGLCPFGVNTTIESGYGLDLGYDSSAGGESTFSPPPGLYYTTMHFAGSGGGNIAPITVVGYGGVVVTNEYVNATGTIMGTWSGTILVPATATISAGAFFQVTTGNIGILNEASITMTRTFSDTPGLPTNQGLVDKLRPVGMSVLATYTGPTLLDGGNIASCFLPAGASDSQFFTSNPTGTTGSLANWENIAGLKGGTTFPITKGIYSWWSPTSLSDYDMHTVSESTTHSYPNIVVSGQSVPGNTAPVDGASYIRIIVTTVYEVTTDSTFLPSRHQKGSQAEMDRVLNHLVGVPHVMENPTHVSFGQKILNAFKSAGNWVWQNRAPIGTAIGALGSLL